MRSKWVQTELAHLFPLKHVVLGLFHGGTNQSQLVCTLPCLQTSHHKSAKLGTCSGYVWIACHSASD